MEPVEQDEDGDYSVAEELHDSDEEACRVDRHGEDELPFEERFNMEDMDNVSSDEEEEVKLLAAGLSNGIIATESEKGILRGRTFSDWKEFNKALDEYQATSGWMFRRVKKDPLFVRARCRGWTKDDVESCKAELYARLIKSSGLITIRRVYLHHTCDVNIHKFRNASHKTSWVAGKIEPHIRINQNTAMSQLNENLRHFHDASSKIWSIQRARAFCREKITGGTKETFQRISAYIEAIRAADKGADAWYQTGEERRFARLYIAPSSSRHVYKYCRPLVGLDGTHTSGQWPMTVLFSTCFDGENHIVILAWAVVKVENGDNWGWFLEHLRVSFPSMREPLTVFISDRDKGLKSAVAESFPDAYHAHCTQHIRINIKGNVDTHCSNYFKKLVTAKTEAEFEKHLTDFRPANERQQKFVGYVRKINPNVYARHAFPAPRFGHTTSNVVEIINAAIKPCRIRPALLLSDFLWNYTMEKHYERAMHAKQLPTGEFALTQYANNMFNRLYTESRAIMKRPSSDTQSLMVDAKGSWAVRLDQKTCDCLDWTELDFPYSHAICLMSSKSMDCRKFVGKVWLASNLREAYEVPIPPLSIDRLETSVDTCFQPLCAGKKKKKKQVKRKPSWGEQQARETERLVKKQAHKCRRCKHPGHNARKCPAFPPESVMGSTFGHPPNDPGLPSSSQALPSTSSQPHTILIVGDVHTATRPRLEAAWSLYHTRTNTQNYSDWYNEGNGSQTGPSQLTQ